MKKLVIALVVAYILTGCFGTRQDSKESLKEQTEILLSK
jgi:PBP1b-binding outer membrane lipoprotein LpoB